FLNNSHEIEQIFISVFPSKNILEKVAKTKISLLISHHLLDYNEINQNFLGFGLDGYEQMRKNNNSFYFLHISLDKDLYFSPSNSLARYLGLTDILPVSEDDFGGELVYGNIETKALLQKIDSMSVKKTIFFDRYTKVCIGAGAGEIGFILSEISKLGVEMYITGDVFRQGSKYLDESMPQYLFEAFKHKLSLVGLSHYYSETFWMVDMQKCLTEQFNIPVHILMDEIREQDLLEHFSEGIELSGNI
ncbi:MAG: Nif3-like dinuclear metal center hexameric protein, partial [Candidatus Gracilibacteria bacterium]